MCIRDSITPELAETTLYYVTIVSEKGCEGPKAPVLATVFDVPTVPVVEDVERCGPGSVTLTASGEKEGSLFRWYNGETAPFAFSEGMSLITPSLAETTSVSYTHLRAH